MMGGKELINSTNTSLKTNKNDVILSILKGLLGIVPYAGSALGEIIAWSIPNQRIDRACAYLEQLANQISKISDIQNSWIEKLKSSRSNLLLFELATKYSIETNSNILHHCYAYFIFNAIENKTLEDSRNEKLLQTLSELKEEEIIHLIKFSQYKVLGFLSEFDDKYEKIIMPKSQTDHITENDIHNAFRDQYILTLELKGLITIIMKNNGTKLPISDKDVHITDYGRLLVEAIYDEEFFERINYGGQ